MFERHFREMCDRNLEQCFDIRLVDKANKITTIFCSTMTDVYDEKKKSITREFDLH